MSRRLRTTALAIIALLSLIALPAAADDDMPVEPDPILEEVTWFMHGADELGEALFVTGLGATIHPMTTVVPTAERAKSHGITNYVGGPNTVCSGNALLPSWSGAMKRGTVRDLTVVLNTAALPATTVEVRLFANTGPACNESAGPELARQTVVLPVGQAEVSVPFGDLDTTLRSLIVMVNVSTTTPTGQGRVFYDAPDALSRIDFVCEVPLGTTPAGVPHTSCDAT